MRIDLFSETFKTTRTQVSVKNVLILSLTYTRSPCLKVICVVERKKCINMCSFEDQGPYSGPLWIWIRIPNTDPDQDRR